MKPTSRKRGDGNDSTRSNRYAQDCYSWGRIKIM
nr:MAG TPA: hypothetical protein [Caudoviricetes sp.]